MAAAEAAGYDVRMNEHAATIRQSIKRSASVIGSLADQVDEIEAVCDAVIAALKAGGKVMTAGHGGSAAEAMHMAEELTGRFDRDRKPLPAIALPADPTLLTCITNDFGFVEVFPRQVEAHGRKGDVLVVFSTSGHGEGLVKAVDIARQDGITTVALLGKTGGDVRDRADLEIIVPDDETARIQEAHQVIMHLILECVDEAFVA